MSCFSCFSPNDGGDIRRSKKRSTRKGLGGHQSIARILSKKTASSRKRNIEAEILRVGNAKNSLKIFTFAELAVATNHFHHDCLLGEGGFGKVYKGHLESMDQDVAVKKLDRKGTQGSREFFQEVLMLSLVKDPCLVNLVGYCAEDDQRILVYEYMDNGCLEKHLLDLSPDSEPLDWHSRMKIAYGAAKGLEYLHDTAEPPIIYRDFKASNILLDNDFNPKLSDFGLAKLGPTDGKDHVSTRVMGTFGYCAPEYAQTGKLTMKSDVYSFGVVLLELITGRRVLDPTRNPGEQNLIEWAEPLFKDRRRFVEMVDPLLEGKYPRKGLYQSLAVSAMCLQEDAENRPLIADVVIGLSHLCNPTDEENERKQHVEWVASATAAASVCADRET